jgi:hypothetical protein
MHDESLGLRKHQRSGSIKTLINNKTKRGEEAIPAAAAPELDFRLEERLILAGFLKTR